MNDDRPMEIETIVDQIDRPDPKTELEKKREEEKKKEEEDKSPKGQVVDLAKPAIEQRPDSAKFLSEYDSKVARETRGKVGSAEAGGAQAVPELSGLKPAKPTLQARPDAAPGAPGPLAMRMPTTKPATSHAPPSSDSPLPIERDGSESATPKSTNEPAAAAQDPKQPKASAAGEGGVPGVPGRPNLVATPEMLQRAIGKGPGSPDYLKDVDDGDGTALNSRKWKHASFFNRVKRAVAREWHPDLIYVRRDPSGNVYGLKDRVTVLRVHVDAEGKLATSNIVQSSGVDFLDEEAAEAFRRAAPFPNVPKELLESDGQMHFNFAFIFELSGRGSFKVYNAK